MVFHFQEFSGRVKGLKVEAVDTTGAGDAFVAGILSQLALDTSLFQVIIIMLQICVLVLHNFGAFVFHSYSLWIFFQRKANVIYFINIK